MKSSESSQSAYVIGSLRLDPLRNVLSAGGVPLGVGPRVVATLAALVERAGEVVTKDELLDRVWPGEDVGESNVAQSVYVVRKVLREHGVGDVIATVPRRGYRFTGEVRPAIAVAILEAIHAPVARVPRPGGTMRVLWSLAAVVFALMLGGATAQSPASPPALSARGSESYRLGRFYWNRRTLADLARGASLFTAVTRSDPRNPLGYSGLADSELMIADYGDRSVHRDLHLARAAAAVRSALALGPRTAEAHTSYAELLLMRDHNDTAATTEFRRAIALDPSYATAHQWYGISLLEHGHEALALHELQNAVALDPASAARTHWLAVAAYYGHDYADAIGYNQRTLELDPQREGALRGLGLAYELAGDYDRAIGAFMRLRASRREGDDAPALLAEAYARSGRMEQAKRWLQVAMRRRPHDFDTALALLATGQHAQAIALLGAMRQTEGGTYSPDDPRLDPLRSDPSVGLPQHVSAT